MQKINRIEHINPQNTKIEKYEKVKNQKQS